MLLAKANVDVVNLDRRTTATVDQDRVLPEPEITESSYSIAHFRFSDDFASFVKQLNRNLAHFYSRATNGFNLNGAKLRLALICSFPESAERKC